MPFNPGNKRLQRARHGAAPGVLQVYLVYLTEKAVLSLSQTDLF